MSRAGDEGGGAQGASERGAEPDEHVPSVLSPVKPTLKSMSGWNIWTQTV